MLRDVYEDTQGKLENDSIFYFNYLPLETYINSFLQHNSLSKQFYLPTAHAINGKRRLLDLTKQKKNTRTSVILASYIVVSIGLAPL